MIVLPMVNPRDSIIAKLNQQLDQNFGAGRAVQKSRQSLTTRYLLLNVNAYTFNYGLTGGFR
ncbi:hypothetical protein CS078_17285 [Pseudomonas prosekii]|uniref:Uncharacterized protein n=1 Tax=Pseudomonas prosekii TaxID=1148509 RepID=A0A3L8CJM9_9PSED|nr:hypothetical protein [Pseudomonas prosekii]RLU08103.1 hypothetical protein CS078_17285 [Pseudomonas prosekii]RLU11571.1 hypothetical protein CS076_10210 [Pseudomonas prosekii]